jgi:hypothetical protein
MKITEVVGAGIQTQSVWGFVLFWRGFLRLDRTCLDTILEYITKDRREKTVKEMGAVVDVDAGGEKEKRIRALLDTTKEAQVQNLETSLRTLTIQFQNHFTTYTLDKIPLKHRFEGIDAKMTEVEALVVRVEKLEALVVRVGKLEALVARVEKLEQLNNTPVSKKSSWFGLGGNTTAGAEKENTIDVLLGDLEKLGGPNEA